MLSLTWVLGIVLLAVQPCERQRCAEREGLAEGQLAASCGICKEQQTAREASCMTVKKNRGTDSGGEKGRARPWTLPSRVAAHRTAVPLAAFLQLRLHSI